jgi:general stress protein 26
MLAEMKALAKHKNICVLATVAGGKPYCSLMAYATDDACTEIYMTTPRATRKFRNLSQNPAVSLLIDTREESPRDTARALTIEGDCAVLEKGLKKQAVQSRLIAAHPHLRSFIDDPGNEILCVRINSFLLLKGLTEAYFAAAD